ncbi:MAG: hypothetical protein PVH41_01440 [Anaerolineae bacterium]
MTALVVLVAPAAAEFTLGACCKADGSCEYVPLATCTGILGATFYEGLTCEESPCGSVGGVTEPLSTAALVLPAVAAAVVVTAGVAAVLAWRRRTA